MTSPIVSPEWLYENLNHPNLIILEARLKENDNAIGIPDARIFDIKKDFSDLESEYPNMLPSPEKFEAGCQKLGINHSSLIVVYDTNGIYASPRIWWMFRTMGHHKIHVLDGGLPEWKRQDFPTENIQTEIPNPGNFKSSFKKEYVKTFEYLQANAETSEALVIDARSAGRFQGKEPEPREGLRGGHIPNSISLPYTEVLHFGKMKSKGKLKAIFKDINRDKRPLVFTCGSGITASVVLLACEMVNENPKSVYDGSWTEWAMRVKE